MKQLRRSRWISAALVSALLFASACGDDDSDSAAPADTDGGSGEQACVDAATTAVEEARADVPLELPPGELDESALDGKTIWMVVPSDIGSEWTSRVAQGFEEAGRALGMDAQVVEGEGDVNNWNTIMTQAATQGIDGVVINSIAPEVIQGPLEDLEAAGIPVIDFGSGGPDDPLSSGIDAHVTADFAASARALSNWVLADSGCDASVISLGIESLNFQKQMLDSIDETFQENCDDCKVAREDIDLTNFVEDVRGKTVNALRREGDVNYIIPVLDLASTLVIPAAEEADFPEVKVLGHDGNAANLDLIREGAQAADASFPPAEALGYMWVDQLARLISGEAPHDWRIPTRLIDDTNVGETDKAQFPEWEGFQDKYVATWTGE